MVCGIENLQLKQSVVNYTTLRLEMFEGKKKFGDITSGGFTDIADQNVPLAWSADYDQSEIDNEPDGEETVTCTFERLTVTERSKIKMEKTTVLHFYAGFNVWENENSKKRLTGGSSAKMELRLMEEGASALSLLAVSIALLASSF